MNRSSRTLQQHIRIANKKLRRKNILNRLLASESLEDRSLMAVDSFAYWNSYIPSDVNLDARVDVKDVLGLIYEVNSTGFRQLGGGDKGEGEAPGTNQTTLMIDVNRDGTFSITDLLEVVHDLNAEGEPPTAAMRVVGVPAGGPATDTQWTNAIGAHTNGEDNGNPGNTGATGGLAYDPVDTPTLSDLPGGTFNTGTEIVAAIKKGDKFELRVFVQDLSANGPGLYSSPFDIGFNTRQIIPIVNEFQEIRFTTATGINGGSFRVSFTENGITQTRTVNGSTSPSTMRSNLRTAMEGMLGGAANVTVEQFNLAPASPINEQFNFRITFKGTREGTNVSTLAVDQVTLTNTGSTAVTAAVSEFDGVFNYQSTNAAALRAAVAASPGTASGLQSYFFYNELIKQVQYIPDNTGNKPDGLHEVWVSGNFDLQTAIAGTIEREYVYIKMTSIDGTTDASGNVVPMNIQLNKPELNSPARLPRDTPNATFPTSEIDYGAAYKLVVLEGVTALADNINSGNAGTADVNGRYTLDLLNNNGNGADFSRDNTPLHLANTLISTTSTLGGSIVRLGERTVGYTPPAGFQIAAANQSGVGIVTDTFTYKLEATDSGLAANVYNQDTATVSVKLFAPNVKPVNVGIPGTTVSISEGGTVNLNGLSVTDADNNGTTNLTMTVTTSVAGQLVVGGAVIGTNLTTFSINKSLVNLNTDLANGFTFTPTNTNFNGTFTITIATDDNGSGVGSSQVDTDVVNVNVTGVNDPPTITAPTSLGTIQDEDILSFTGPNAITIADVDADEGTGSRSLTFTITAKLNNTTPHGTFSGGTAGAGTVTLNGTLATLNTAIAALQYTADAAFLGPYTFSIVVSDNGNGTNGNPAGTPQTAFHDMTLQIDPSARPKAVADIASLPEDGGDTLLPSVLTNDKIHPTGTAAVTAGSISNIVATPAAAIASLYTLPIAIPAGLVTQTGNDISVNASLLPDFFGTITFQYLLEDGVATDPGAVPAATVTVTVTNVADAPRRNATATTPVNGTEETQVTLDLSSYFFDPDGDALSAVLNAENPASPAGTFTLAQPINAFQYTPATNFFGLKGLRFNASDGTAQSTGTADVDVTFANTGDKPVVQSFTIADFAEDPTVQPVTISLAGRITDPDGGTIDLANLTNLSVTPTVAGTVGTDANGLTFTPRANYHGPVSISYAIKDGDFPTNAALTSNTGTVTFTITPVNDAPVANDDTNIVAGEGQTIQINVIGNDFDVDRDTTNFVGVPGTLQAGTTIIITQVPGLGTASVVAGRIHYTAPSVVLTQQVTTLKYKLNDGTVDSTEATVTITVTPKNDPPVIGIGTTPLTKSVNEDPAAPLAINLFTEASVSDPDTNQSLWTIEVVSGPAHGSLTLGANGLVEYTPALNYNGPDSFSYRVRDNDTIAPTNLPSAVAGVVNITVNETNDAPVAVADTQSNGIGLVIVNDNNSLTNIIDVLANDNFGPDAAAIDGPLKLVSVGVAGKTAQGGDVTITADGKVSYKSPAGLKDFNDSFTYTIQDRNGTGLTATGTASFFVQEAVPVSINIQVFQDKSVSSTVLGDGVRQATEGGYAGVQFSITGIDFKGVAVDLRDTNGQYFETGMDGKLTIPRLLPGNYRIQEIQPAMLQDGNDSSPDIIANSNYVTASGNDIFDLVIPTVPQPNADLAIDLFFGEVGLSASYMTLQDMLVSAGNSGMNLGLDSTGTITWAQCLPGWNNVKAVSGVLSADRTTLTLKITPNDGTPDVTLVLYQTGAIKFRLYRPDGGGNMSIRIDRDAAYYGLTQFA